MVATVPQSILEGHFLVIGYAYLPTCRIRDHSEYINVEAFSRTYSDLEKAKGACEWLNDTGQIFDHNNQKVSIDDAA